MTHYTGEALGESEESWESEGSDRSSSGGSSDEVCVCVRGWVGVCLFVCGWVWAWVWVGGCGRGCGWVGGCAWACGWVCVWCVWLRENCKRYMREICRLG